MQCSQFDRDSRRPARQHLILLTMLLSIPWAFAEGRAKTDEIVLDNGDRITGKIKKMDLGILQLSTDRLDTVNVEWDHVASISSVYDFQFETSDGQFFFGVPKPGDGPRQIIIERPVGDATLEFDWVVKITPINARFLQKIDGSLSAGFSFTKASEFTQFNTAFSATYQERKYALRLSANSIVSSESGAQSTTRADVTFGYTRFLVHKTFANGAISFQTNDELGINLRVNTSGTYGKRFVQTNHSRFSAAAGLAVDREYDTDGSNDTNLEGVARVDFSMFRYDSPKTDLTTAMTVFPSLTQSGRVRSEFNINFRHELISDFFWDLSAYNSYDSEPPTEDASKNDYGIVTSLGWSF